MSGPVVVTGLGVLCSTARDVPSFAAALRTGTCGIREVDGAGKQDGPRILAPLGEFDMEAALMSCPALPSAMVRGALRAARRSPLPVQAALVVALQGWQHAGLDVRPVAGDRLSLIVGGSNLSAQYVFEQHLVYDRQPAYVPARYALHVQDTDHVGTLSQVLGITGEGCTVGASSASGSAALLHAARLVECGAADVAFAVGGLTLLGPLEWRGLATLGALAVRGGAGACRPFDRGRGGFVPGEGAACVVLESAASAEARGATVLAHVAGYAQRLDGNSLSDPSVAGESRTMAAALDRAGIAAADLDYVNAHATGTPAGDDAELRALGGVLGDAVGKPWLNATKALVGHCLSAAGTIEAVATVVQLRDGFVHANPALDDPVDPAFRFAGRTAVPAGLDRALTNSFGFGGFNTALVLIRG